RRAAAAVEQGGTDLFLQAAHLQADGGGGQEDPLGGFGKAVSLCNGDESAQLVQIHKLKFPCSNKKNISFDLIYQQDHSPAHRNPNERSTPMDTFLFTISFTAAALLINGAFFPGMIG
ncbi:MAG: hypothetical protein RLN80_10525, partial [Rhodospirillales bacterium]